ncbi:outer membrane beta-barrel protein [Pinibacter soli]|uniref:Outer membrane protein beta-barrel domain-containing protein n=1 Tax=Pinibacter soli TaxID=3044211 RepID=A0ABT6R9T5_9BACT|nr:outer membrane beta-barrel protein [Pinibacter soli]MDI3318662.1 hypothetical protein [Pinibacter soli]
MTKILCCCLAIILAISANAQINKGAFLLGGDVGFGDSKNSSSYSNNAYTGGGFSVSLGKAINENKVIGFTLGFNSSKQNSEGTVANFDTSSVKSNTYNVGFFYRDYKKLAKDFYFFTQANAGYFYSTQKYDYTVNKLNTNKQVQNGGNVSIAPGIAYKLFKKMYLELSLNNLVYANYTATNTTYEETDKKLKGHNFSIGTSFTNNGFLSNIGMGFRFIL